MEVKRLGIATILAAIMFASVFGLATAIDIKGVHVLGSNHVDLPACPNVDEVRWDIQGDNDYSTVMFILISLDENVPDSTMLCFYVELTDDAGKVIYRSNSEYLGKPETEYYAIRVWDGSWIGSVRPRPIEDIYDIRITISNSY